tara:strand:+ start:426 stop:2459 length:2034 start_codon:yes stop_codon:yes gene_type:complete
MKLERSTYQKPLSMTGFGGGATSLGFGGGVEARNNFWPFSLKESVVVDGKTPSYSIGDKTTNNFLVTTGFYIKPDGSAIFSMLTDNIIRRHTLGTAWDISTASEDQKTSTLLSTTLGGGNSETLRGLEFKSDGTFLYYADDTYIYQYALSTPWDLSTLSSSYTHRTNFSIPLSTDYAISSIKFRSDGSKIYVVRHGLNGSYSSTLFPVNGRYADYYTSYTDPATTQCRIYQVDLSTNFDISSSGSVNSEFFVSSVRGISFKSDGSAMWANVVDGSGHRIDYYDLTTPWNTNTRTNRTGISYYDVSPNAWGLGMNMHWRTDSGYDGKVHYNPIWNGRIYQDTTRSVVQNGNTDSYVINAPSLQGWWIGLQDSSYTNFTSPDSGYVLGDSPEAVQFSNDGTKLFYWEGGSLGRAGISTAYDIRSIPTGSANKQNASWTKNGSSNLAVRSMVFNSDGTKLLLEGIGHGSNYAQFSLIQMTTAYDHTTMINSANNYAISSSDISPASLNDLRAGCITSNGLHVYALQSEFVENTGSGDNWVSGADNYGIHQWTMSTAFDPSSASYVRKAYIQDRASAMRMSPDGKQLITFTDDSTNNDTIKHMEMTSYSLGTAFDISTITRKHTSVIGNLNIPFTNMDYNNPSRFCVTIVSNGEGASENGFYFWDEKAGHWGFKLKVAPLE